MSIKHAIVASLLLTSVAHARAATVTYSFESPLSSPIPISLTIAATSQPWEIQQGGGFTAPATLSLAGTGVTSLQASAGLFSISQGSFAPPSLWLVELFGNTQGINGTLQYFGQDDTLSFTLSQIGMSQGFYSTDAPVSNCHNAPCQLTVTDPITVSVGEPWSAMLLLAPLAFLAATKGRRIYNHECF